MNYDTYVRSIDELGDLGKGMADDTPDATPQLATPPGLLETYSNLTENEANVAVVSALLAAAVSNILPDPSDGFYLGGQMWLDANRNKLEDWQVLSVVLSTYYIPTFLWYSGLAYIALKTPGVHKKLATIGTVMGVGAVVGLATVWLMGKHK